MSQQLTQSLPTSSSTKQTAIQVLQVLLPLSLLTGISLSMNTMTASPKFQPKASSSVQTSTEVGFAGHCEHIGIQAHTPASRPIHERGAFASDANLQCLHNTQ